MPVMDPVAGTSVDERSAAGKAARKAVPRSEHAGWAPAADRRDPVEVITAEDEARVPELVPIRYGRMLASPFTFYRGAAAIMAMDLATTPDSGFRVQTCGDAHLSNFGVFGAPDRRLVFDLNDFDETLPAPWEWDVKRLAASFEIGARDRGFTKKEGREAVLDATRSYRQAMAEFAAKRNLDVWYARLDIEERFATLEALADKEQARKLEKQVDKAKRKDSLRALERLSTEVDGHLRIEADPPLLVPIESLAPPDMRDDIEGPIVELLRSYRETLKEDRRRLFDRYQYVHLARKVVGVGSVGTRAWVVLLVGRDTGDPLFLQVKEAEASVLEPYAGASDYESHGERVVQGQWLMQAASDVLLGWLPRATGIDGKERDFYVRQLWDWKRSAEVETMAPDAFAIYAQLCGWTLARAHARSGDPIAIASYLGKGPKFDEAIAEFADAYADQTERDYAALKAAVDDGRIAVETDV